MSFELDALAERLDAAACSAQAVAQLDGTLTLDDAYAIQRASIARRLSRGERRIGMKMGFTSRAKMKQMGVSDMICGQLTDAMLVEEGGATSLRKYVHPRVEPEVAFLLGEPLHGKVTLPQAMAAVEGIAPAMEIIDSRYQDFRFSLTDVVADNSSSSGLVVGSWRRPDTDFSNLGLIVSFNGHAQIFGSTAAILGHPLRSLVAAARFAEACGDRLEAGSIVLAGGATAALPLCAGLHVMLEVEQLGRCSFRVEN